MTPNLLMLEDDPDRLARFRPVVARLGLTLMVWRTAPAMIVELPLWLPAAKLIALDHDLEPLSAGHDPGDGRDVARFLGPLRPSCPVLIHTSNSRRGDAMEGELQLGGWRYARVLPFGDDWVEVEWYRAVRRLLRRRSLSAGDAGG